jgi:hypothetical protein
VLEPVVARYRNTVKRRSLTADAAFALPEVYSFLEPEGFGYAIRLPANAVLQRNIGHLLKRPVGRPPHEVRRYCASFSYRAASWDRPRRVAAKVEWHPGELYPRVGFIVTNLARLPSGSSPSTTSAARRSSVGVDGPHGIDCARMRSLQISDDGDHPWNRLAELVWIRRSTFSNFTG